MHLARHARSLTSYLSELWTGRAAETPATWSRHLSGLAIEELERIRGSPIELPTPVPIGTLAGLLPSGTPLHLTAGDKNCELLGSGVTHAGQGGLSLGSAISLGTAVTFQPAAAEAGIVVTPAAVAGGWNIETGLLVGMRAENYWKRVLQGDHSLRPELLDGLWCLPHLAGALDHPELPGALVGLTELVGPGDVYQAWGQGVVGELRRLRPALEAASGARLETLTVNGTAGATGAWARLLADALALPVTPLADPWRGARGAVLSALLAVAPADDAAGFRDRSSAGEETVLLPDPGGVARATRYYTIQEELQRQTIEVLRGIQR